MPQQASGHPGTWTSLGGRGRRAHLWPLVFSGALMGCMDWEQARATGHVAAACSALAAGVVVLLVPKGRQPHRVAGTVYVCALVVVNVAALSLHREDTFGVFHALAVVSLVTLGVGLTPLLLGRRSPEVLAVHAYCMTWSYAGLVAAGCGQLAAAVGEDAGAWMVPAGIAATLTICAAVIFVKVPQTLERVLEGR
jgi:uncharacterized membrane protein